MIHETKKNKKNYDDDSIYGVKRIKQNTWTNATC